MKLYFVISLIWTISWVNQLSECSISFILHVIQNGFLQKLGRKGKHKENPMLHHWRVLGITTKFRGIIYNLEFLFKLHCLKPFLKPLFKTLQGLHWATITSIKSSMKSATTFKTKLWCLPLAPTLEALLAPLRTRKLSVPTY